MSLNEPSLIESSYEQAFNEIAQKYEIKYDISLSTLVGIQDLFQVVERQDEETIRELVLAALEEAPDKVKDMCV